MSENICKHISIDMLDGVFPVTFCSLAFHM